jgi:hypothetical protein
MKQVCDPRVHVPTPEAIIVQYVDVFVVGFTKAGVTSAKFGLGVSAAKIVPLLNFVPALRTAARPM